MSIPRFSVNNTVLVNMFMIVILVAGTLFALTLVREMFPESRPDKLAISTIYPGVQPQEIEKAVTIKIEEAVRDVEGIEKVESTVSEGGSLTILTLLSEVANVDQVLLDVKTEVDALEDLPVDAENTTVRKLEPKLPVISVALTGGSDTFANRSALKRAGRKLRDDLLLLPGVSEVEISGEIDDEISIEIQPDQLRKYDITFEEVALAVRRENLDLSGGRLESERSLVSLRTLGEELAGRDLEDIVIRSFSDGRNIYLRDVAIVHDKFVETDLEAFFNGKPAISCVVYKTAAQDAIQIAQLVKAYVAGKQQKPYDPFGLIAADQLPWNRRFLAKASANFSWLVNMISGRPDPRRIYDESRAMPFDHHFELALHSDLARFIEERIDLMLRNGKSGLALVLMSLLLFLNWRVALWAGLGMPVSFLGTFILMWVFGQTVNLISLMGLIIVLGIIVDDAIVIGENIYRHMEEGMPSREAAIHGAEEVMWPVTVAVATTIASFAPLLFISGQIGDFLGVLPMVVMAALSVSLFEAIVVLPAHLAEMPPPKPAHDSKPKAGWKARVSRFFGPALELQERFMKSLVDDVYERLLRFALRWRYQTLALALASVTVILGLSAGGFVKTVFVQDMDSETLIANLEMPVGTPATRTKERLQTLSDFAESLPEVTSTQMFVARQIDVAAAGATGNTDQSHLGQIILELQPAGLRTRSSSQILATLREVSERLPGTNAVGWEALNGGPGGKDIEIKLTSPNFTELQELRNVVKDKLATYAGVFDLDDDFDEGQREVRIRLLESARPTGITVAALAGHVRAAFYGQEAQRLTRNREDVKVMVRYPKSYRKDVYNLESMWIPSPTSVPGDRAWIPLRSIAELEEDRSYSSIHRSQQQRSITVTGDVDQVQGNAGDIVTSVEKWFDDEIQRQYPGTRLEFLGEAQEFAKATSSLKIAFPVALLLIYMMLAGLFRSYFQPLVVMAAIPFGIQGAIVGHWITGYDMTIISYIGLVALTGIVVNDSLVLVDFINSRVRNGMSLYEASIQGSKLRLRAILLTTATTVAGLTPLMFETSFQAAFLIPMAVTLTFGLVFATVLTLILVPTLNIIFFDIREWAHWIWSGESFVPETTSSQDASTSTAAP